MSNPLHRQRADVTEFPNNDNAMSDVGAWPSVGDSDEFGERVTSYQKADTEPLPMPLWSIEKITGVLLTGWSFYATGTHYLMRHECGYQADLERGCPATSDATREIAAAHKCRATEAA